MSLRTKLLRRKDVVDAADSALKKWQQESLVKNTKEKRIQSEFSNIGKGRNLVSVEEREAILADYANASSTSNGQPEPELPWDHPNHWHHNKLRKVK